MASIYYRLTINFFGSRLNIQAINSTCDSHVYQLNDNCHNDLKFAILREVKLQIKEKEEEKKVENILLKKLGPNRFPIHEHDTNNREINYLDEILYSNDELELYYSFARKNNFNIYLINLIWRWLSLLLDKLNKE